MKKLLSAVLIGAMALSLAACGGNTEGPKPEAPASEAPASEAPASEAPASEAPASEGTDYSNFSVGMITDTGGVNDQSFNQSAWEGLQAFEQETGAKVSYRESEQEANYGPNIDSLVDADTDLIWGIGFMMGDAISNAATTNPDIKFAIVDNAYDETPANLTAVVFRAQEPSFLVGYMAGMTTETNKVGFVGGIKGEVIDQFEFGYRAGVAYAAKELGKEIEVLVQYADSFGDDAKGKAIATSMYTNGADIVFHAAGNVGQGVIAAAKDMDKLVIGVDRDQAYLAPDNVMTSALKLVGAAMKDVSKRIADGEELGGQTLAYGIAEESAGIPPYEGSTANLVDKEVYDKTMEIKDKIVSGDIIDIPVSEEEFNEFVTGL
ncbi:BMP family ABC transporter substrate-binding protein [Anaeropeptidivorans aminofermentans]|uniref:BMP family ABC transporter substrate-binding protein n=1 Tax=Anaeropeptidivorans aminofermentans TaxID=2934315 RepID=UPI002023CBCB|nr:BMP family ABC transporter substrate-binding protein [Anaeropeptidivorans aminofermentans]